MFWKKEPARNIFLNYRRADSRAVAGRLSDSLAAYFGDDRVFRDTEDIEGGADFEDVIHNILSSASALIVLIGPDWVSATDSEGRRRLDDPNDLVVQEIAAALERRVPVYPVLVEDTPMPRVEDLPEALHSLVRHNAVTVSDQRWSEDVTRLAKALSFDIPESAAERVLERLRWGISVSLLASVLFTSAVVFWNSYRSAPFEAKGLTEVEAEAAASVAGKVASVNHFLHPFERDLLGRAQSAVTMVVIMGCALLLLVYKDLVDESKRLWVYVSAGVGALGAGLCFILLNFLELPDEPMAMFFGSTVIAMAMLVFMNVSGLKPK